MTFALWIGVLVGVAVFVAIVTLVASECASIALMASSTTISFPDDARIE